MLRLPSPATLPNFEASINNALDVSVKSVAFSLRINSPLNSPFSKIFCSTINGSVANIGLWATLIKS